MKQIKKILVMLLVFGLMLSLTGCKDKLSALMDMLPGAMSIEKLAETVEEAGGIPVPTELTVSIPVTGSITEDDETVEYSMMLEGILQKESEEKEYEELRIECEVDELWFSQRLDTYRVVEDDEFVTYTHDRLSDSWQRTALGFTVADMAEYNAKIEEAIARYREKYPFDLTRAVLAEETQIVCNREVYVVEYSVSGQELQGMWDALDPVTLYNDLYSKMTVETETEEESEELEKKIMDAIKDSVMLDFGLEKLSVNYVLYIDAETFKPVQETYEIIGIDGVIDAVLDGFMTVIFDILDEMEVEYDKGEVPKISIEVDDITIVTNGYRYDPVTVPEVPERGLIITAQESFDPDLGDGTYVIQEYGDAVRISVPEGWMPVVDGYYGLTLTKQDENQQEIWGATETAVFVMYGEDYTEEDFKATVAQNEEYFKSLEIYHETTNPEVEGYTVYRLNNMRLNAYYAWKPVGDGWLFIEYYDVTVQDMENTFLPMLSQISDYQL